jgi:hypothetical protein
MTRKMTKWSSLPMLTVLCKMMGTLPGMGQK